MCGGKADNLQNRSYVYDNGEQFVVAVCPKCQEVHFKMLQKEKNV
jgi:predicted  nucleic acid-binding Zn-ribbon protein